MAFVSSTIASDLFTGDVALEPLRITSKKEVQKRYGEANGDRVKLAQLCLDVLESFTQIPLEIQGIDVDRGDVVYVVLDGRPKDKSLAYVYAKHLGYSAYVPFPKHYFEQKVRLTVPNTEFDVRTFLCRRSVPAPYRWENKGSEYLLSYMTPGSDGNLADRTYAATVQIVKTRLEEANVRSTVTGGEMSFHEAAVDKAFFVMPHSAAELFPDAQGDGRSASTIGRAIGALLVPPPPKSILRVGAAPVKPERLRLEEQRRKEERARRGISPSDELNWAKAGGASEGGSLDGRKVHNAKSSGGGRNVNVPIPRGEVWSCSSSSGGRGADSSSTQKHDIPSRSTSSSGGRGAGSSSTPQKHGNSSLSNSNGGRGAGSSSTPQKHGTSSVRSSSTPRKREISNDTYELREAEDGPRTRTKRQINLEIQAARENIGVLKSKGIKGKELEQLKMLISALQKESEKSPQSLDPAAPVFVPAVPLPKSTSTSSTAALLPTPAASTSTASIPVSSSTPAALTSTSTSLPATPTAVAAASSSATVEPPPTSAQAAFARSRIEQIDLAIIHHQGMIAGLEVERKMYEGML